MEIVIRIFTVLLWLSVIKSSCSRSTKLGFAHSPDGGNFMTMPCRTVSMGNIDCSHLKLKDIPSGIPKSVEILDLSHNRIDVVPLETFVGFFKLRILFLDHNSISRKSIVKNLFKDLKNLQELYLNHNEINKFSDDDFYYLSNVQILDLSDMNNGVPAQFPSKLFDSMEKLIDLRLNRDGLRSFDFFKGTTLTKLEWLSLSQNLVEHIEKDDFAYLNGSILNRLDLSLNRIDSIDPLSFSQINSIHSLDLTQSLKSPSVIQPLGLALSQIAVTNLSLAHISLLSLNSSTFKTFNNSSLKCLYLNLNNISKIEDNSFQYLQELQNLSLYKNNISVIGPGAFKSLRDLRLLDLANNSLTSLNESVFQSLSGSNLQRVYLEKNAIVSIAPGSFLGLEKMKFLKLSKNKITYFFQGDEFEGMPNLEYLDLGLNPQISLDSNAFKQIPKLKYLYLNVIGLKKLTAKLSPFRFLRSLMTLDISNNSLSVISAPNVFGNLTNLKKIYLQHNNLYHLWEDQKQPINFLNGLNSLQVAYLSYNGFSFIPEGTFGNSKNLKMLLLAHNKISKIPSSSMTGLDALQKLQLHYNNINIISESSFHPFLETLKSLSISNNPISCSCELEWFRKWINKTAVDITDLDRVICAAPPELKGNNIVNYWPDPYICDGLLRPMYYGIIFGSLGFVIGVMLTLYCCRWRIRYCLLRGKARSRYRQRDGYQRLSGRNTNCTSDVFISYSSKDAAWVKDVLEPELKKSENDQEHFEYIDHDETFIAGETIQNNIIAAIDDSRKTLCVLSKNYLESEWCRYEQEVAMFKHLGDKRCLIVIRLDDVTDQDLKSHDQIHQVMRRDTYLKWPSDEAATVIKKVFWERLKEALAKSEEDNCKWCFCCC